MIVSCRKRTDSSLRFWLALYSYFNRISKYILINSFIINGFWQGADFKRNERIPKFFLSVFVSGFHMNFSSSSSQFISTYYFIWIVCFLAEVLISERYICSNRVELKNSGNSLCYWGGEHQSPKKQLNRIEALLRCAFAFVRKNISLSIE